MATSNWSSVAAIPASTAVGVSAPTSFHVRHPLSTLSVTGAPAWTVLRESGVASGELMDTLLSCFSGFVSCGDLQGFS